MRLIPLLSILLASSTAFAADMPANIPSGALNPPAYAPQPNPASIDGEKLQDAAAAQALKETSPPSDPTAAARDRYLRLNNQLGADVRNHAGRDTIKADREAIAKAKKELDAVPLPEKPAQPTR